MPDRSPWPRRLIMPLVILAVAAGLAWWGGRVDTRQHAEVHALVTAVCNDILDGNDPTPRLEATDPLVRRMLVERLRDALAPGGRLAIEVTEGDSPEAGTATGTATHIAVVKLDGTPVMHLRIACDSGTVAIIGFY